MHTVRLTLLLLGLALAIQAAPLSGRVLPLAQLTPVLDAPATVHHVPPVKTRPVIDGVAGDWAGVPAIVLDNKEQARGWSGPEDLHGSLRLQWSSEGLFFCLEVADNVHYASNADRDWWENDGCQFAFDAYMNGPSGGYDADEQSYMVCDSPQGTRFIVYREAGSPSEVAKLLPDRAVGLREQDGVRVYEWMMPWTQLAPVSPWLLGQCGFTFTLNDNDGNGFKGAMFWTKGLIYGQDAARFGRLVFDGARDAQAAMLGLPPEEQFTDLQTDSAWLPTPGVPPWSTARLLVRVPGGGPVAGTVTLYSAGGKKPLAVGTLQGQAPADQPLLLTWELGDLPAGAYEIDYAVTQPALGSRRLPFTRYRLDALRARREWLRATFATDRPWDALADAPAHIRRHRGLAALALSLLADSSWTVPMSNVDKDDEQRKALLYCAAMVRALDKGQDFLGAQRGSFWSAYYSPTDGSGQSFVVTLPPKFDPKQTYPLLVALHGAGGVPVVRPPSAASDAVITVQPWARGASSGYRGLSEDDVLRVIAEMTTWYKIDPDRVYLSGGSMGGCGTWTLAARHPDLFAAAAPVCGYPDGMPLENLRHVPVFNQHGEQDWSVPIDQSRLAVAALQTRGYAVVHKEYPRDGHSIAHAVNTVPWLLAHRRVAQPATVTFTCDRPDAPWNRAYWLTVRALQDPHRPARVQARTQGHGAQQSLALAPDNARVLELEVAAMPLDRAAGLLVQIDATFLERAAPLPARLFAVRGDAGWTLQETWAPFADPARPYRAGGDGNLYTGEPLMIVYGTRCAEARREALRGAAQVLAAYPGGRREPLPAARFAVKADSEVTAEDMLRCNLILLGGLRENALTTLILPRLPIIVNAQNELLAGDREPVSLRGAVLQLTYFNPLAPRRLIHLLATDEDGNEARAMLKEPQYWLNGVWAAPGDVPDLQVLQLDRTARRFMQFTDGWQWRRLPGADRLAPPAHYSDRAYVRAVLRATRAAAGADIALHWEASPEQERPAPERPCLTYADLAVMRAPLATVTGTLTGEELAAVYTLAITRGELASEPAFTPETLDPQRRYRVVLPADALWAANTYQRNLRDTAAGPLVPQEDIRAALER